MIEFNNSYQDLPDDFYSVVPSAKVCEPVLLAFNAKLAKEGLGLELEHRSDQELAELFTGQVIPQSASSIALAYAGHQFGNFVPELGDGRAMLLGEVLTPKGDRFDIQLKGSGRTPYSRGGDGKSSLGPVLREYIVSEAMFALGIPTTRALAAASTGDFVQREKSLPGGVLTRVASSHIRIGTFEFFSARRDVEGLKKLLNYAINRHYPALKDSDNQALAFLEQVAHAQAEMVAHWMSVGFIHGVMNTDNMTISGETLDYGPCAFMDNFAFDRVFSSIDRQGRYSYNNQIEIAQWNLYRLASCLLPLIAEDPDEGMRLGNQSLESYLHLYDDKWTSRMGKKLGLLDTEPGDKGLIRQWLTYLETEDLDFTQSFRSLAGEPYHFKRTPLFDEFYAQWQVRLEKQTLSTEESKALMNQVNPVFIPRNHQIERAIQGGLTGDFSVFQEMIEVLKNPFTEQPQFAIYQTPPLAEQRIKATFCGT